MSFFKATRKADRALLNTYHAKACEACGLKPSGDYKTHPAHIRSRGAGGPDETWNVIPLCLTHHQEQHKMGWRHMAIKYHWVRIFLEDHGWKFVGNKLAREGS